MSKRGTTSSDCVDVEEALSGTVTRGANGERQDEDGVNSPRRMVQWQMSEGEGLTSDSAGGIRTQKDKTGQ